MRARNVSRSLAEGGDVVRIMIVEMLWDFSMALSRAVGMVEMFRPGRMGVSVMLAD